MIGVILPPGLRTCPATPRRQYIDHVYILTITPTLERDECWLARYVVECFPILGFGLNYIGHREELPQPDLAVDSQARQISFQCRGESRVFLFQKEPQSPESALTSTNAKYQSKPQSGNLMPHTIHASIHSDAVIEARTSNGRRGRATAFPSMNDKTHACK